MTDRLPRDLDTLIFQRRRTRAPKACYPCRRRKIKCDRGHPCDKCQARGYPDLCVYSTPNSDSTGTTTDNRSPDEQVPSFTSSPAKQEGLYVDSSELYSSKVHLGPGSLPSLLSVYQSLHPGASDSVTSLPLDGQFAPQMLFEALCLHNSSNTFQFSVLWAPEDGPEKVYSALPEDEIIYKLYQVCQGSLFHFLPIIDFDSFNEILELYLQSRRHNMGNVPPACTTSWFALLFSILACGRQLSSDNQQDIMASRVFACCSFHCLRLSNFISYPDVSVIQTLVLLVNFLSNQADAGASWAMLGLAIRLAQSIGLQSTPNLDTQDDQPMALTKINLWRSLIWQDTIISLCYDRTPSIMLFEPLPTDLDTDTDTRYSFFDGFHHLFVVANKTCQDLERVKCLGQPLSTDKIVEFQRTLNRVESKMALYVQDVSKCQNRHDRIQHYFFRVFSDSVLLCVCRSAALSNRTEDPEQQLTNLYWSRSRSLMNAYLELLWLECPTQRCWIFVHAALSCALSLGLRTRESGIHSDNALLKQFVEALSQTTICRHPGPYKTSLQYLEQLVGAEEASSQNHS